MKKKYQEAVAASKTYSRLKTTHAITFDDLSDPKLKETYKQHKVCGFTLSKAARLNTPNLSPTQKLVLSAICDFASPQAISSPSQSITLEQSTGLTRRAINKSIAKLSNLNYILAKKSHGRGCLYLINAPLLLGFAFPSDENDVPISTTPDENHVPTLIRNNNIPPKPNPDPFIDDSFVFDWNGCKNDPPSIPPPPSPPNHPTSNTYTFDPDLQSLPFLFPHLTSRSPFCYNLFQSGSTGLWTKPPRERRIG